MAVRCCDQGYSADASFCGRCGQRLRATAAETARSHGPDDAPKATWSLWIDEHLPLLDADEPPSDLQG